MEEKVFLKQYNQDDYKRPSVAVDMTVFSVLDLKPDNYRKLPEKAFSLLLIKRAEHPFKNKWALPGGFVREGESVEQAAKRELNEETGIEKADLQQLHLFSAPKRDPRGWIVSSAFWALTEPPKTPLTATRDAAEARWFSVKYRLIEQKTYAFKNGCRNTSTYHLQLTAGDIVLNSTVELRETVSLYNKEVCYKILHNDGLAFDHAQIIAFAITQIRQELGRSAVAFRFLPDLFTLTSLQQVYETILDKKLLTANFRRKMSPYVTETAKSVANAGHRPAQLYKRNLNAFLKDNTW